MNKKIRVCIVDLSIEKIAAWNSPNLPIYERGLLAAVESCRDKNLFFSTDVEEEVKNANIVFIAVDAPTKTSGIGAGLTLDIKNCEMCARTIKNVSLGDKIVVERSTVPVRTAEVIHLLLNGKRLDSDENDGNNGEPKFEVLSNPEFLSEGNEFNQRISNSCCPNSNNSASRVLIGSRNTTSGKIAAQTLIDIYARWIPRSRILTTNLWSSELSKLAANAFLAQRVSSINAMSVLCEVTGADVTDLSRAIGSDDRIGDKFLRASIGFGGSGFKKDLLNLIYLCQYYRLEECASYWMGILTMNDYQIKRFSEKLVSSMFSTVTGKKILILGFAFKKDTCDVRETPSALVMKELLKEGSDLYVYDPQVKREDMLKEIERIGDNGDDTAPENNNKLFSAESLEKGVKTTTNIYDVCEKAHALVILTPWDEFKNLDFQMIYASMAKPAFIFDGHNILDHDLLRGIGYDVHAIGKGAD